MSACPLFPSLVSGSRGPSSRHLVEFRAGKMMQKGGSTVYPDKRKGLVYVQHSDDSLIHFCWKDRNTGDVEDDLIIFPDDCEFKRVNKCTTGRVYVLKFKTGTKRLFFWMQEPKVDKDEEHCRKVNEYIHNPPGAPGGGGSHELSALGGEGVLQNLLENMDPNQLMQLISTGQGSLSALGALAGPGVLASLLGSGGPASNSSSSSSSSSSSRSVSEAASQSSGATPWLSVQTSTSPPAAPTASSTSSPTGGGLTPSPPAAFPFAQTPNTPNQPIQLSDLQNILATMNNNGGYAPAAAAAGAQGSSGVDLTSVCTPEMMAPILCSAEVQQILLPLLPSGESLPQSPEEINDTSTPQFQQAMSLFAVALASGQLGPLLGQFGLSPEAVDAANRGDLDAFANAVENSNKGGASKDKDKDDDEDNMSLD